MPAIIAPLTREARHYTAGLSAAPGGSACHWHWTMKRLIGFLGFAISVLIGAEAAAQPIQIGYRECAAEVALTVRGARLSEVLQQLSETLGFQLQFEGTSDPVIDVDVSRQAPELVAKLSPTDSIMVSQAADPRCPNRKRIVKVWVLPKAGNGAVPTPAPPPPKPVAQPPAQTAVQYDPKRVDEMAKKAKEMYNEYVRIHGVPPPTPEEEAAK
jgi:hypothetical protein